VRTSCESCCGGLASECKHGTWGSSPPPCARQRQHRVDVMARGSSQRLCTRPGMATSGHAGTSSLCPRGRCVARSHQCGAWPRLREARRVQRLSEDHLIAELPSLSVTRCGVLAVHRTSGAHHSTEMHRCPSRPSRQVLVAQADRERATPSDSYLPPSLAIPRRRNSRLRTATLEQVGRAEAWLSPEDYARAVGLHLRTVYERLAMWEGRRRLGWPVWDGHRWLIAPAVADPARCAAFLSALPAREPLADLLPPHCTRQPEA
jgi:hypothetical protein